MNNYKEAKEVVYRSLNSKLSWSPEVFMYKDVIIVVNRDMSKDDYKYCSSVRFFKTDKVVELIGKHGKEVEELPELLEYAEVESEKYA